MAVYKKFKNTNDMVKRKGADKIMDFNRAQEIFDSVTAISVFHNGKSVWIESLDQSNRTATVRTPSEHMTVHVKELNEVH